jgi:GH15 family glucan-1,4-alpha-glucosidase
MRQDDIREADPRRRRGEERRSWLRHGRSGLVERSIATILEGQADSGGYVACPTFEPYRYAWLRDGSFVADAMSRVGQVESAERFFDFCAGVIRRRPQGPWQARYRLDGSEDESDWPLHQLDGLGLWLWALDAHCARRGRPREQWADAAELTHAYLAEHWHDPCVDWWEEREGLHAATLASIWAGTRHERVREAIEPDGRLDASLLWLVPLGLAGHELVRRVEHALVSPGGGVHRNLGDVYYGGGEWLLLTAFLGWARLTVGDRDGARDALAWVEAHAGEDGSLPEQSQDYLLAPESYATWVEKWGTPPSPLLWSHAMYLILADELGEP